MSKSQPGVFKVMRNFSFAVLLLSLVGCDQASIFTSAVADPKLAPAAQLPRVGDAGKGWQLAKQCAECHGLDGASARSGAPFIAGLEQEYLIRSMLAYRNGARNHADMKQVSENLNSMALADITAYYASLETKWQGAVADTQSRSILWNDKARSEAQHIVQSCRSCHSQVNRYQKKEAIPNLDGMPAEYFIPTLKSYVSGGRHNEIMANFKSRLSDADIYNLAAYFAARTPQKSQLPEVGDPVKGKVAARACAGCHGYDGNSLNPHIPNLAGQSFRYLVKASKDYRDGVRHSQLMQAPLQHLSDTNIVNIAAYFSRQAPQSQLHKDIASAKAFNPLADGEKIAAACSGCHGANGNSTKAGVPSLTGMHVKYIVRATQAYQHGQRQHLAMQDIVSFYSDTDMAKAAYFYALQVPVARTGQGGGNWEKGEQLSVGCGNCHGKQGVSADPATTPSLAGQDETYLVAATKAYASGKRQHDGMKGVAQKLGEQDIKDLAAYFSAQTAQQVETYLPDDPARLVQERCSRCHGERGYSDMPGVPRLAGQIESYIIHAMKEYQDGLRKDKSMVAMAGVLSLLEIKAIAAYYAKQ